MLAGMFLRCTTRKKNGKENRYWNLVKNRRVSGGAVVQRQVLYLGEINDTQREVWRKSIEVFEAQSSDRSNRTSCLGIPSSLNFAVVDCR
jgi:hypothetical protein